MKFYLIYKYSVVFLFFISITLTKLYANPVTDNYPWLELGGQEINIYFGRFPDKKEDISGLSNLSAFYTAGEKDNRGNEIYYPLEVEKSESSAKITIGSKISDWFKVIVTAAEVKGGKEYNYCSMVSAIIPENVGQVVRDTGHSSPRINFARTFDMSIYRERLKEEFSEYRKRFFPLRVRVSFDGAAFSSRLIKIINRRGDSQEVETDENGEFAYVPTDKSDAKPSRGKTINADLIVARQSLDDKIYLGCLTIHFTDALTKERNFNFPVGLIIFFSSFITSFFFLSRRRR